MVASRIAPGLAPLASLLLLLSGSSCTNAEAPSDGGPATNAGGAATGGSTGSNGAVGGAGAATGGAAGTMANVAGLGGGGLGGSAGSSGAGGSSGASGTSGAAGSSGAGGTSGASGFTLTSPELNEGSAFADEHTCAAAGFSGSLSPALAWTAGPEGTKSYAITLIDVTLTEGPQPSDLGYHWVLYDIPAATLSLPEAFTNAGSIGAQQNSAYLGPCPNFSGGSEVHTYEFTIYALDTETLSVTPTTGTGAVKDAEAKLEANHLAVAKLTGTSDASPP